MPGTSDQWSALDRQNERLVDAGGQQSPTVWPATLEPDDAPSPDGERSPVGSDHSGRHRTRGRSAAAAVAAMLVGGAGRRPRAAA